MEIMTKLITVVGFTRSSAIGSDNSGKYTKIKEGYPYSFYNGQEIPLIDFIRFH